MKIKVVYMDELKPIYRWIEVDELNYKKIRKKLEYERKKIIEVFKEMVKQGTIKSVHGTPKNKKFKNTINSLMNAKKTIKDSIEKIKTIFY